MEDPALERYQRYLLCLSAAELDAEEAMLKYGLERPIEGDGQSELFDHLSDRLTVLFNTRGAMEEERRLEELRQGKAEALAAWKALYRTIMAERGIYPPHEEYDVPWCFQYRAGLKVDEMATLFGYDYTQDFVDHVWAVHSRYKKYTAMRIPPRGAALAS